MLTGDDLSTQYFVAGTAIAILGIAMTQAGWTHRLFVRGMFTVGGLLAICAAFWKSITETFPRISEIANPIGSSSLAWLTLLIVGFGVVFWLDYRARIGTKRPHDARQQEPDAMALNNALQGLFDRVGRIEQLPPPVTTVPNPNSERDLLILINYAVYQSSLLMLDDLLDVAPQDVTIGPLQLGGDFTLKNDLSKNFIDTIRRKLEPGSFRRMDFENVMRHAEVNAETQLENTPMDQRPNGVDPLQLRRWAINHLQCLIAIEFLQKQRSEVRDNLLTQRTQLLEQYQLRNPN
jgi:hypothetical protein